MQQQDERKYDPTPLYNSPQELERVLFSMTQGDQAKDASLLLGEFFKKKESVACLVQQMEQSGNASTRHMAAVYLRQQVEKYWKNLDNDLQQKIKPFLLTRLQSSTERGECLAIGATISSIAKIAIPKDEWNELLPTLQHFCTPDKPVQLREVSMLLWRNLITYCGGSLKQHFGTILDILKAGLFDAISPKVQVESFKGIGAMVEFLENDNEVKVIQGFVPQMVAVVEEFMKKGDEESVVECMGVFNELMESDVPVLSSHALQLCSFMATICKTKDLPLKVRKQAANFLTWAVRTRPKMVVKHNLTHHLLELCTNLVIESEGTRVDDDGNVIDKDDGDDADGDDDGGDDIRLSGSTLGFACDLLDEIFLNIPVEIAFPLAIQIVDGCLPNPDASHRKGAYVTLAMMAEGCAEMIVREDNLGKLLERCVRGLSDENVDCRKCACEAITQFSTHIPTEILKYHQVVLQPLFMLLQNDKEDLRVKERALGTVEMFVENMDDREMLKPYLQALMSTLAACMNVADQSIQEQALMTLASVASSAKEDFIPYFDKVVELLKRIIKTKDDNLITLRAEATSCLGAIATAVGRERFQPVLEDLHADILQGVDCESAELRENTFMYFGDLASILGPDLFNLPDFRDVLDSILIVMDDDDGMIVKLPDDGFGDVPSAYTDDADDDGADDDADNEAGQKLMNLSEAELQQLIHAAETGETDGVDPQLLAQLEDTMNNDAGGSGDDDEAELDDPLGQMKTVKLAIASGFMEEKAAAVHALTQIAKHCGPHFLNVLEEAWTHIIELWEYPHPLVKIALANCINEILKLVVNQATHNERPQWQAGDVSLKYPEAVTKITSDIFPMWIDAIKEEEDRDTLTLIVDNFMEQLRILGPSAINEHMESLCVSINLFLKEKCACQNAEKGDDDETAGTTGKHRWVSDSVAELIGVLAEIWGPKFDGAFSEFFPNILRFAAPNRHAHDQAMAVGCIADVASYLAKYPGIMDKFAPQALDLACRIARSDETNMRQNGLYLFGAMWQACTQSTVLPYANSAMEIIERYLQFSKDGPRGEALVRDNAVSALGKMMINDPDTIPFEKYLQPWLGSLPLTADYSENKYVYKIVADLTLQHHQIMGNNVAPAITLLANAINHEGTDSEAKDVLKGYFQEITKPNSPYLSLVQQLSPELSAAVQELVHSK